jgi:hypothetical protein
VKVNIGFHTEELMDAIQSDHLEFNGDAEVWQYDEDGWQKTPFISPDPYSLIMPFAYIGYNGESAMVMYGWAAPIDEVSEDTMPSQHPGRRRLRVVVQLIGTDIRCVLHFKDEGFYKIIDESGAGMLAEAVADALEVVKAQEEE